MTIKETQDETKKLLISTTDEEKKQISKVLESARPKEEEGVKPSSLNAINIGVGK